MAQNHDATYPNLQQSRVLFTVWLALLLLTGCSRGSTTPTPPEIRYGEDICTHCQMIISDPRFAAAYAYEVDPGRFNSIAFDDIGDMIDYAASHPTDRVAEWYVHDYLSEAWIDATTATYVKHRTIAAPMGSGLAAFAQTADAEAYAQERDGELLTWDKIYQDTSIAHP
jgi:copper chaperone NosL